MYAAYGFHWDPFSKTPWLITPDGKAIDCKVRHNVPYIEPDVMQSIAATVVSAPFFPASEPRMECTALHGLSAVNEHMFAQRTEPAPGKQGATPSRSQAFDLQDSFQVGRSLRDAEGPELATESTVAADSSFCDLGNKNKTTSTKLTRNRHPPPGGVRVRRLPQP